MGGGSVCWWERPCCDKRLQVRIPSRVSFNTRATFKEVCVKRNRIETHGRVCAKSCVSSKKGRVPEHNFHAWKHCQPLERQSKSRAVLPFWRAA